MIDSQQYKNAKRFIYLLVALNLITLATVFFTREHRPPPPDGMQIFIHELDLNESQQQQFRTLREQHFQRTDSLFQRVRSNKQNMIRALVSNPPDTITANRIARESGALNEQLEFLLIRHFFDLKSVCTPDQQATLGRIFLEGSHPKQGPPPPPRR